MTHGQELDFVVAELNSLGKFHQIARGIRPRAQNKHDWRHGRALLKYRLITDDGWGNVFLTHASGDVFRDCAVDSVHTETTEQHEP